MMHCDVRIDPETLPDDPALLRQLLCELHAENDTLRLLIDRLTRHQFGRRSEQLTPDQLQLGLEDLEQTIAENQAGQDAAEPPGAEAGDGKSKPRADRPARNHGALPAHLPRYEVVIDAEHAACPCCGSTMHSIGELRTEQLDMVPQSLKSLRASTQIGPCRRHNAYEPDARCSTSNLANACHPPCRLRILTEAAQAF